MAAPLAFWFDFSSPYGYLAAQRIEALAARHGRGVDWHPMLLGVAFVRKPHDQPAWLQRVAQLRDPAGTLVELWQRLPAA